MELAGPLLLPLSAVKINKLRLKYSCVNAHILIRAGLRVLKIFCGFPLPSIAVSHSYTSNSTRKEDTDINTHSMMTEKWCEGRFPLRLSAWQWLMAVFLSLSAEEPDNKAQFPLWWVWIRLNLPAMNAFDELRPRFGEKGDRSQTQEAAGNCLTQCYDSHSCFWAPITLDYVGQLHQLCFISQHRCTQVGTEDQTVTPIKQSPRWKSKSNHSEVTCWVLFMPPWK